MTIRLADNTSFILITRLIVEPTGSFFIWLKIEFIGNDDGTLLGLPDGRSDGVIGFVTGKRISRVLSCTVIYLG